MNESFVFTRNVSCPLLGYYCYKITTHHLTSVLCVFQYKLNLEIGLHLSLQKHWAIELLWATLKMDIKHSGSNWAIKPCATVIYLVWTNDLNITTVHGAIYLWRKRGWSLMTLKHSNKFCLPTTFRPSCKGPQHKWKDIRQKLGVNLMSFYLTFWY